MAGKKDKTPAIDRERIPQVPSCRRKKRVQGNNYLFTGKPPCLVGGELHILKMSLDDLLQVLSIEKKSFHAPWSMNMFVEELNSVHSRSLVAKLRSEPHDEVAGYVIYLPVAGEVHLHNLAVRPNLRGRGIGSELMKAMFMYSRAEGATRATLEVRPSNEAAIKLYEKFWFVVKGVRPLYYSDTKEDALIMWAELAEKGNNNHE